MHSSRAAFSSLHTQHGCMDLKRQPEIPSSAGCCFEGTGQCESLMAAQECEGETTMMGVKVSIRKGRTAGGWGGASGFMTG